MPPSDNYPGIPIDFPFSVLRPLPRESLEYTEIEGGNWIPWPRHITPPSPLQLSRTKPGRPLFVENPGLPKIHSLHIKDPSLGNIWRWDSHNAEWKEEDANGEEDAN